MLSFKSDSIGVPSDRLISGNVLFLSLREDSISLTFKRSLWIAPVLKFGEVECKSEFVEIRIPPS